MSKPHTSTGDADAGRYEVRLKGHLADRWSTWFDGLTLTRDSDGTTVITGDVVDQAALHGLLQKVRDTGLSLISVEHVDRDQHDTATPDSPENHQHNTTRRTT
jgi:hypothetical protein